MSSDQPHSRIVSRSAINVLRNMPKAWAPTLLHWPRSDKKIKAVEMVFFGDDIAICHLCERIMQRNDL